jgi:hypothetical protein
LGGLTDTESRCTELTTPTGSDGLHGISVQGLESRCCAPPREILQPRMAEVLGLGRYLIEKEATIL